MTLVKTLFLVAALTSISFAQDKQQLSKADKPETKVEKTLPKTVGLTEVQRLKDENLQLKLARLQDQINLLNNERSELLMGALKVAGVEGADLRKYQYDQSNFVFTLQPEKSEVAAPPKKQ